MPEQLQQLPAFPEQNVTQVNIPSAQLMEICAVFNLNIAT